MNTYDGKYIIVKNGCMNDYYPWKRDGVNDFILLDDKPLLFDWYDDDTIIGVDTS